MHFIQTHTIARKLTVATATSIVKVWVEEEPEKPSRLLEAIQPQPQTHSFSTIEILAFHDLCNHLQFDFYLKLQQVYIPQRVSLLTQNI